MRKIYVLLVMNFSLCLCALRAQNAESWNLVWREDFGVAEDTLIKNFADKSNSVPGHCFIDDERFCNGQIVWDAASNSNICDGFYDCRPKTAGASGCGSIDDGFYGITSNTWWAYNRWASCKNNAGHFVAGKDHTGNKNGAMLVINSGVGEGDAIFSKKIEFNLCDSREYRFVIYVASITAYGNDDPAEPSGGNADLEMNVINATTGKVVETIRTGAIPYWKAEGWGDSGGGIADTEAERKWSEYSCEFIANDGDVLELQVTNWGSGYNDFAIDDISLYRKDTEEVPDPIISTNTIASSSTIVDGCIFMAAFKVPDDVLPAWKKIYDNVYFLWQKSEDDGLTWQNVLEVSGIEKTSVDIEVDKEVPTVYRVIITGGSSETIAEEQALYIAQNGAPKDGCAYYSISNTLAGVSPTPDCSFSESARIVWKEDFGVMDSFSTRPFEGAALHYYEPTADGFKIGDYVVTSAPDSSIKKIRQNWDGTFLGYDYDGKSLQDPSGKPNGAFLYTYFGKKSAESSENVLIEKSIEGPFCKCKSFNFSFQFYDFNEWAGENLDVEILDDEDNILGSSSIEINNSNSRRWVRSVTPFVLPLNYSGGIKFRILNATPSNDWNYISFDDFQIAVCGETAPKGSIQIDDNPSFSLLNGFSCNEEPLHTVNKLDDSEWKSAFPDYGFAWQYSEDGGDWSLLSDKPSVTHEAEAGVLVNYRMVFAETAEEALNIAKNGKPNDPCTIYGFSNVVGLKCKDDGCRAPIFEFEMVKDTMAICSDIEEKVTLSVVQKNKTNVDKMQWYSSPADKATWTAIEGATGETLSVLPADSTDYLFIALNDTCYSDSIFARINVHEEIRFDKLKNESGVLCDYDETHEISYELLSGSPTEYVWNDEGGISPIYSFGKLTENDSIFISFYATDGVCTSNVQNDTFWVEKRNKFAWDKLDYVVCEGEDLEFTFPEELAKEYEESGWQSMWKYGDELYSSNFSETFDITESVTLKNTITTEVCYEDEFVFNVSFVANPKIRLSADKDSICLGTSVVLEAVSSEEDLLGWQLLKMVDGDKEVLSTEQQESYSIEPTEDASYFIYVSDNGCGEFSSDTVRIVVDKPVDYSFESIPEKVCAGDEVTLKATSIGAEAKSIQWLKNGTIVSSELSFEDEPSESTAYQFEAKAGKCPVFTKTFQVDVEVSSELTITVVNSRVCEGDAVALSATYGDSKSIEWQYSTDNVNFKSFSTDLSEEQSFAQEEEFKPTYFFRLKAEGSGLCPVVYSKTVKVEVEPKLEIEWDEDMEVCKGSSVNINFGLTEAEQALYDFSWTSEGAVVSNEMNYQTPDLEKSVEYTFEAKSEVCPVVSHTFGITVQSLVELTLTADKENICEGEEVSFTAVFGTADELKWYSISENGTGSAEVISTDLVATKNITPTASKLYWIEYGGNDVCPQTVTSDFVLISVEEAIKTKLSDAPDAVCYGTEVTLSATQTAGLSDDHEWLKNGVVVTSDEEYALTDTPTENPTIYSFVTKGIYCKSDTQSVSVAVERSAELTLSSDFSELCQDEDFTLFAEFGEATILNWEVSTDGANFVKFSDELVATQKITAEKSAAYRLSTAGTGVCEAVYSNIVNVDVEEKVTITLPNDMLVCPNVSVDLSAEVTGEPKLLVWEKKVGDGAFVAANLSGLKHTVQPTETVTYRLTADMGVCEDVSDEVVVSVDEIPELDIMVGAKELCEGADVALSSSYPLVANLKWYVKEGNGSFVELQSGVSELVVSPKKDATYKVVATSEVGCDAGELMEEVKVYEPVEITLEDKMICEKDSVLLKIEGLKRYDEITWSANGANIASDATILAKPTATTTYEVLVKNGLCEGTAMAQVQVIATPKVVSCEEVSNKTYQVVVESELQPVYYDYGDGREPTTSDLFTNVGYGKSYTITVSNEVGCSSSYELETPTYDIVIPPYFVPENGSWKVENLDRYNNAKVKIYDRFGKLLVELDGAESEGWDGTYQGKKMPSTDYWYVITIGELDKLYSGHFTLMRGN